MSAALKRLQAEADSFAAGGARRDDIRAQKLVVKATEKREREAPEDPCLLLCTTKCLREELRECFDEGGVLKPRAEHHEQLLHERAGFLAMRIFPGSLEAQNARVDQQSACITAPTPLPCLPCLSLPLTKHPSPPLLLCSVRRHALFGLGGL